MTTCPVCRADHIGSLMRPKALRDAHKAHAAGRLSDADFARAQDDAVAQAVRMQEAAGLGTVTDGEFRRRSWFAGFVDAVEGLTHKDTEFNFMEEGEAAISVPVPHAAAPIRRTGGICTHELGHAKKVATKPVKITMPAPSVIHFFRGPDGIDPKVYPDIEKFWTDLVAVYRAEIAELGRMGLTYLQLDDVPPALLCDAKIQQRIAHWGWDWRVLLDKYIWANNQVLKGRPKGMNAGVHLCRGNFRGHFIGSGGYEPVAEKFFNEVDADLFLLEYDSERAGDFAPLRFLPKTKSVVLGLVSSKTAELENPSDLKRRIDAAAKYVPHERLAISPQCGFGTTVGGAPMTEDDQKRKLELVGEVARQVWNA
ncbi:MAG: 5-methyltetrahydropteroyltriglutamate--homocysteine S-methyltransferase [Alphaproteobacteria bacterium]